MVNLNQIICYFSGRLQIVTEKVFIIDGIDNNNTKGYNGLLAISKQYSNNLKPSKAKNAPLHHVRGKSAEHKYRRATDSLIGPSQ